MKKRIARLQYITRGERPEDILAEAEAFLTGGGEWVQLRMKEATDGERAETGRRVKALCDRYGAVLIVDDRVNVALAIGADGVHLGKDDMSTELARAILGHEAIIGRTANTLEDVLAIAAGENDYIGMGPYRYTTTKKRLSPLLGAEGYRRVFGALEAAGKDCPPVVGIGGVLAEDIPLLAETGLYGLAVSGGIGTAADPVAMTRRMLTDIRKFFPGPDKSQSDKNERNT